MPTKSIKIAKHGNSDYGLFHKSTMKRWGLKSANILDFTYSETELTFSYTYAVNLKSVLQRDVKKLAQIIKDNPDIENHEMALKFAFNIEGAKKEIMEVRFYAAVECLQGMAEL